MSGVNLFPARIEIGQWQGPDGRPVKVYPSPEFVRALSSLAVQVGGTTGLDSDSLATLASFAQAEPVPDQFDAPQEASFAGEVSALRDQLAQALALLEGARAESSALVSRLEALELLVGLAPTPAANDPVDGPLWFGPDLGQVIYRLEAVELGQQLAPVGADWEHPGKIGVRTANSGAFTTLTASGNVTLSPTGTVAISPTGALTIAPTAVSTMNNVDIGTATPKTGTFTALNNDREIRSTQATGGAFLGMWSLSANVNSRNFTLASQSVAFGQCELIISNARLGDPIAAGTLVWTATLAGFKVVGAFGCNGAAIQTSLASGGALAAYAAGANGLSTGAEMSALHALVVKLRAALVANGIMS